MLTLYLRAGTFKYGSLQTGNIKRENEVFKKINEETTEKLEFDHCGTTKNDFFISYKLIKNIF